MGTRSSRSKVHRVRRRLQAAVEHLELRRLLSASATYLGNDSHLQGNWGSSFGTDGYSLLDVSSLPSYAQVSTQNASGWAWQSPSGELRALQSGPGSSSRVAACDYSATSFTPRASLWV